MEDHEQDIHWMRQALELAYCGLGTSSPNPPVGCVIVESGEIIGSGFHRQAGESHAEVMALKDVEMRKNSPRLSQASLYVTLEPCSSFGRTPPCTEAIKASGIPRVVYAVTDVQANHLGKAKIILQQANIQCVTCILSDECNELIRGFRMKTLEGRPWVIAKVGMSLDGRIRRAPSQSSWLTGPESKSYVHQLRVQSDAILVGGNTARTDDPALTIRCPFIPCPEVKKQPWRVLLTQDRATLPSSLKCFTDQYADRTLVWEKVKNLRTEVLEPLAKQYDTSILLLECGGHLLSQFLNQGLVDEWIGIYAPLICGGSSCSTDIASYLDPEVHLHHVKHIQLGDDLCLRALIKRD